MLYGSEKLQKYLCITFSLVVSSSSSKLWVRSMLDRSGNGLFRSFFLTVFAGGVCILGLSLSFADDSMFWVRVHFSQILSLGLEVSELGCWPSLFVLSLIVKSIAFFSTSYYKKMNG